VIKGFLFLNVPTLFYFVFVFFGPPCDGGFLFLFSLFLFLFPKA